MKKNIVLNKLIDSDYILTEGAGWFEVKGFAIRINSTDEGVVVDVYKNGKEDEESISSCYAFYSELEEKVVEY